MPDTRNKTPNWTGSAEAKEHLWSPSSTSDECYLPENQCMKRGSKHRCSVCKILFHEDCIPIAAQDDRLSCRPTFREVADVRSYRGDKHGTAHHWLQHRYAKGKCSVCSKGLQPKLFSCRELAVITCSWCKTSHHNREVCFTQEVRESVCNLGYHASIIVPPTWILKLQDKGDFRSSLRAKKFDQEKLTEDQRHFIVKPIPTASVNPVIVFINPKSGGNQGVKLLQKFQWLLNPRQVFDLTQGGPNMGLELYKRVPQLRVLACGGDGTAGWVLSVIDKLGFSPAPAVGVLPLGTGNDLARALGWGGGYTDEPISKILNNIGMSEVILLDRWKLSVSANPDSGDEARSGKDDLPLNVVNNYFSLGVDAHIALEFHQAREAHPERFNSRLRNKMFYGQRGGKDLLRRKWKALSDYVTLSCDGTDYTQLLKEYKFHAIVFLNIPSYGGGTRPWPKAAEQSTEDGLIEVVGLTTFQLPLLQAGGHGDKICQCRTAQIVTTKTIPMQVDGEACKLNPSIINLELLNKAPMLAKKKSGKNTDTKSGLLTVKANINLLKMLDYEQHLNDKNQLKAKATVLGDVNVPIDTDLEQMRSKINEIISSRGQFISSDWCFIDSCTAERFFRIDRAQENLHYVTDIANEDIFILEATGESLDLETALPSPNSDFDHNEYIRSDGKSVSKISIVITDESNSAKSSIEDEVGRPSVKELLRKMEEPISKSLLSKNLTQSSLELGFFHRNFRNPLGISSGRVLEAAKSGDLKKVKELHSEGYSLLSQSETGETALHLAAHLGHSHLVKYLITTAPHQIINMTDDKRNETALHRAVMSKHKNITIMLVAAGASLTKPDRNGRTPIDLSTDPDITLYLKSQEEFQKKAGNSYLAE